MNSLKIAFAAIAGSVAAVSLETEYSVKTLVGQPVVDYFAQSTIDRLANSIRAASKEVQGQIEGVDKQALSLCMQAEKDMTATNSYVQTMKSLRDAEFALFRSSVTISFNELEIDLRIAQASDYYDVPCPDGITQNDGNAYYNYVDGKCTLKTPVVPAPAPVPSGPRLLFRQTAPMYKKKADWMRVGETDTESNYSRLDTMEECRGKDNKFHLKIKWPERSDKDSNEWKQSSNPFKKQTGGVDGYEPIDIGFTSMYWGGLEFTTGGSSVLDGSVNHGNWYYAIGSTGPWGGGIPGPDSKAVNKVELYCM